MYELDGLSCGTGLDGVLINGAATLSDLVAGLNALGVSPRDLIAIIESLQRSGALQAELEVI